MHTTFTLALVIAACIAPIAANPSGCATTYNGDFEITVVKPSTKRSITKRDSTCGRDGYLTLKLQDGQLTDSKGRLGYVASNYQFQFDQPPQGNALSIGGYSACRNGSLALADSTVFYQCLSGDFYNLYDRSWAAHCQPILIELLPCQADAVTVDNQPPKLSPVNPVSQISDGQPQAPTATPRIPVSQITDGQPQAPSATLAPPPPPPPHNITTPARPTGMPVSQISDGQPQAPMTTRKSIASASVYFSTSTSITPTSTPVPITAGGSFNKASSYSALIIAAAVILLF